MKYVDFGVFDADNHYYEAPDALTRYVSKDMRERCTQWATVGKRSRLIINGELSHYIPNPSWNPVARPGSLEDFFRGKAPPIFGELDPIEEHQDFMNRDARIKTMDEQGVDKAFFFPTQAVGIQSHFLHDIEALHYQYHAFNEWLLEDWGFGADGRILGAPLIAFSDPEKAVKEIEWAVDNGAKLICGLPGPVPRGHGLFQLPSMPEYYPIWDCINQLNIPVALHGGDTASEDIVQKYWEPKNTTHIFDQSTFRWYYDNTQMVTTMFAGMLCHGLFERFPNLRIMSIENSSAWVEPMLNAVKVAVKKSTAEFKEDPVEMFKRHVWISPNFEDNINHLKSVIGTEQILFGSDWPHAEGLDYPTKYVKDIEAFTTPEEVRMIMRENALKLVA